MSNLNNKLTTLEHLRLLAVKVKSEDDALAARIDAAIADIEALAAVGSEANILEGLKVNGEALAITDKMVDILIESGTENGTIKVNGATVAIKGLTELAFAEEITEDDLAEALKASIAAKATNADLEALTVRVTNTEGEITEIKGDIEAIQNAGYQNAEQVEAIAKAAVAASGHAHFEKVDAVPTVEDAQENVMYLVPNATTGHYDIYALISGKVELLDDTTIDLSNYSTTEQMTAAISAAIEGLKIGDYAKLVDLNAAVERITAVETALSNVYTKEEAEERFMDAEETQAIADAAADEAETAAKAHADEQAATAEQNAKNYADNQIAAATATDEAFQNMMGEVWTPNT